MCSLADALLLNGLPDSLIESGASSREAFIAIRTDGRAGSGTENDPFDGSGFGFDAAMIKLAPPHPDSVVVRLGPGIFRTKGSAVGAWACRNGQRIIGSGIHATTLRLQLTQTPDIAIHPESAVFDQRTGLDGYEISDLTFDCNMALQPHTHTNNVDDGCARIAVRAVALLGKDIRIRRVRVIHWGTQSANRECFPIGIGGPLNPAGNLRAKNCVIEQCIVERPGFNNYTMTTCLQLHGGQYAAGSGLALAQHDYHEDCAIRDNYVNCELVADEKRILVATSLVESEEAGIAELDTAEAHGLDPGEWIVVAGAIVEGAWSQRFNGAFEVLDVSGNRLYYCMNTAAGEEGDPEKASGSARLLCSALVSSIWRTWRSARTCTK